MRQTKRQNGFVLIIVVVLLGVMGLGIAVWAAQTRDLLTRTKLQTVQAGLDTAIASAAQWAKINTNTLNKASEGQWMHLDLKELQISGLECQYRVIDKNTQRTVIEITAAGNFRSHLIKKTIRVSL